MAMSALVFAGSAQFIAVGLVSAQAPVVIIILTTFIVNLRHMLYSATLLPYLKKSPQRWRIPLAFWLTDETFAVTVHRFQANDGSAYKHWYQSGIRPGVRIGTVSESNMQRDPRDQRLQARTNQ
jgi:predicted branched-subunit amino acid permease